MQNTLTSFYGQQTEENILYTLKPHKISLYISITKIVLASMVLASLGFIIENQISALPKQFVSYFILAGVVFGLLGTIVLISMYKKTIAYVTNRRIIRFMSHTPFATSTRSLTWDQAVKAKTLPSNVFYKALKIGNITVHSSSTVLAIDEKTTNNTVVNDDIMLAHVYYYKDLGNYIEKIIYTFKNNPSEVKNIKPFILKPKGKRY